MRMVQLTKQEKENILENLLKRSPNQYDEYQEAVNEILENVKKEGDKAVFDYTKRFDKANISKETLYVTEDEIKEAYSLVDADLIETMKKSIANIRDFHERQVRNSWFHTREDGVILGQRITALASVGVYVPGGKAAYPSSVLMNIIPAKVAGVKRIVMATPRERRKSDTGHFGSCSFGRRLRSCKGWRCTGDCSARLWNGINSESR